MPYHDTQSKQFVAQNTVWDTQVTITGNLFDHKCKGLNKPKCTRTVTVHAITLEFVMPNEMLER